MIPDFYKKFSQKWLSDSTIYLVRHGSRAYATNVESSDEDFKGVAIPPIEYFFGQEKFEQAELNEPDAVIYEIKKFAKLASQCNPSIIEVLFVDPSDVIHITKVGQKLLDNRDKFLSKSVKNTMQGYARSQFQKIKLHRSWLFNPITHCPTREELGLPERCEVSVHQIQAAEADISKELEALEFHGLSGLDEPDRLHVKATMAEILAKLKLGADERWQACARSIGINDNLIEILKAERGYRNAVNNYNNYKAWEKNRNPKRAADEKKYGFDLKFAYHLVRLTRMASEILLTGKVLVKRPDAEELIAIRNGAWSYEKLEEFFEEENKKINNLYATTNVLPQTTDQKFVSNLLVEIIKEHLNA